MSQPAAAGPIPLVQPGCAGLAIGHRGAPREPSEDTLPSEERSQQLGSDYLELDLHLTKDGVPVVMHDDTVDRTTDGTGAVADLTLAQVETLDAGSWFSPAFAGTKVATFAQILRFAKRTGVRIMPELKAGWDRAQVKVAVDLVKRWGLASHTVFQSFDPKALAYAAALAPGIAAPASSTAGSRRIRSPTCVRSAARPCCRRTTSSTATSSARSMPPTSR